MPLGGYFYYYYYYYHYYYYHTSILHNVVGIFRLFVYLHICNDSSGCCVFAPHHLSLLTSFHSLNWVWTIFWKHFRTELFASHKTAQTKCGRETFRRFCATQTIFILYKLYKFTTDIYIEIVLFLFRHMSETGCWLQETVSPRRNDRAQLSRSQAVRGNGRDRLGKLAGVIVSPTHRPRCLTQTSLSTSPKSDTGRLTVGGREQRSFRKTGTVGTLASPAEIGVCVQKNFEIVYAKSRNLVHYRP